MKIELKILNKEFYKEHPLPKYGTEGSAGLDLTITEDVMIIPNMTKLCRTGLAIWIGSAQQQLETQGEIFGRGCPMAGLIIPRSGTGHKKGLILGNGTGLLDSDYNGELMISIWNRSEFVQEVKAGDRIAQLVFVPVIQATFNIVDEFSNTTERGSNGFGSTDLNGSIGK